MNPCFALGRILQRCSPRIDRRAGSSRSKLIEMDGSEEYDRYSSGRYLYVIHSVLRNLLTSCSFNEARRLEERHHVFDVAQLQKIAVAAINKEIADIATFRKLAEVGFNRVFELTMHDGAQVQLPYPFTYPKHFTVASEVATMDYVSMPCGSSPRFQSKDLFTTPVFRGRAITSPSKRS